MVNRTKIQEEIKSKMHDFAAKNNIHGMHLISSLLYLKIMLKKMDEISIVKVVETNNKLKELETEKTDKWELLQENIKSLGH